MPLKNRDLPWLSGFIRKRPRNRVEWEVLRKLELEQGARVEKSFDLSFNEMYYPLSTASTFRYREVLFCWDWHDVVPISCT